MAELGIAIDGRAPIADIAAQAQAAEEGGASTLWIACHLFLRDPVTTAALALAATKKIRIALMAMSPYSTHPVYIAMAAASLDEMYPGRVILCLGAGAPADLKAAGIDSPKPLVAIGEAVKICRQLFAGEMADFDGQMFKVSGRRLANGGRDIPIVIAASRPNMLKLAGRDSDGVLISAATSPPFVKACLDHGGCRPRSRASSTPSSARSIRSAGRSASCCAAPITPRTSAWAARASTSRRWRRPMPRRTGARSTGW